LGHGFQVRPVDGRIVVRPAPENWKQAVAESPASGHRRGAQVLCCALFALFGWWPISRTASVQLGIVFGLGFSSQLCEIMLRASAEAGGLHPIVGAWMGVGFGTLLLLCLAAVRYFTRNQKPV
jgi:lipopolysaccharide export LptBFGC system permease protein LptF